jgi:iron complex outermembrane receptor protein
MQTALNGSGKRALLASAHTACCLGIALAAGNPARAQTPPASPATPKQPAPQANSAVETVVVTAEKRRVNVQKVPIAITALSAKTLAAKGITSTADLSAAVPGLIINNAANVGNPYIRGVGSNLFDPSSEQSVAIYVDGVYIAAPEANLFALNNVERIEVLKGPQGTLFGRNATGGVIQIITKDPSQTPYAEASVGFGSYDTVTSSLYATGPITSTLAGDIAVQYANQGQGYGTNFTTGAPTFREAIGNIDARSKLFFRPQDGTKITFSIDYAHDVETNAYQKPQGAVSPFTGAGYPGAYNADEDLNSRNRVNTGGVSLTLNQDLGFMDVVNIASYRATDVVYPFDDDVSPLPIADVILIDHAHNISEELQLVSKAGGWLKWLLGSYYFKGTGAYPEVYIDNTLQVSDKQITESESGFGQATATVFDTNFTAGLRYTNEDQNFYESAPELYRTSQSVDRLTYRLAVDREIVQDVMAYVSYNRGFKSGGFNLLAPGNTFKPEILDSTEVGIKSEFLDNHARLNLDAFYYNYQDIQVLIPVLGGTIVGNSAAAHIKGVEGDLTVVPLDGLTINASLAYLDGRYRDDPNDGPIASDGAVLPPINAAGRHTPNTPPVTASVSANYLVDTQYGTFSPSGSVVYNDGYYWQPDNRLIQPAYTLVNASVLWTHTNGKYSVQLWGKNLAQATYYIARIAAAGIGDAQEQAPPRTVGVTLKVRF